jgi:hypothetical protein
VVTKEEALELALEALDWSNKEINDWRDDAYGYDPVDHPEIITAITAIKEALAQPAQEPVAEVVEDYFSKQVKGTNNWHALPNGTKLYTTPPQRPWVGLTDEEILDLYHEFVDFLESDDLEYERAIEAKLKEKNS